MREISENDLRWFAARLSIELEEVRRSGGMSIHELKQALRHIPGFDRLTLGYARNGNQLLTIGETTVEVAPTASNDEIALAFRAPPMSTPNVTVTNQPATGTMDMSITGAAPAALSIKDLIANSRSAVKTAHDKLITNATKVNDAAAALNSLGDDLGKEGDDLLAMVGQFKNDLSGTSSA